MFSSAAAAGTCTFGARGVLSVCCRDKVCRVNFYDLLTVIRFGVPLQLLCTVCKVDIVYWHAFPCRERLCQTERIGHEKRILFLIRDQIVCGMSSLADDVAGFAASCGSRMGRGRCAIP